MSSRKKLRSMSEARTEAKPSIKWKPGSIIADVYRVEPLEIHDGGYGSINLVHHLKWNVDLIVKTPNETTIREAGGIERFKKREAYEWVRLGLHPNIVSCFYVRILEDGIPRVFIEYVNGGNLADWLKRGKATDLITALDIAIQICWGIGWAHKQKPALVHRDIKPANILMTADGTPKVTDFGLVKRVDEAGEYETTDNQAEPARRATTIGGTMGYAAPEQWKSGAPVTSAADVYAIGVVLYELLQLPLGLSTFTEAHPQALPALRRSELKKRGDSLSQILLRSMAHKPEERYLDAMSLAEALVQTYSAVAGEAYFRKAPDETRILADGLNNQALSLLDLGKQEEAEKVWEQALQIAPHHPESTYNLGLVLWRSARITDDALVQRIQEVIASRPGEWLPAYLLGQVHLERDDCEAAVGILNSIERTDANRAEVVSTLATAKDRLPHSKHHLGTFESERHTGSVNSVCLGADGRYALSASYDSIKLWEVATNQCLRTFEGDTYAVYAVCLSGDGRYALSGSHKTLKLWDVATGQCLRTFEGHTDWVTSVCLSRDGQYALSGSKDRTLKLWKVANGKCLRTFKGHTDVVTSVCLSADGQYALSGSEDKTLKLWAISPWLKVKDAIKKIPLKMNLVGPLASLNQESVAAKLLRITRSITRPKYLFSVITRDMYIFQLDVLFKAAVESHQKWMGIHNIPRAERSHFERLHLLWTFAKLFATNISWCLKTFSWHADEVTSVCLSVDGRFALSGSKDKTIKLWDFTTGRCLRTFEGHTEGVVSVCLSADGQYALSGSDDTTLKLWEVASARCLRTFEGHTSEMTLVCLSADGHYALSRERFGETIRVWMLDRKVRIFSADIMLSRALTSETAISTQTVYVHEMNAARRAFVRGDAVESAHHIRSARAQPGYKQAQDAMAAWGDLYVRLPLQRFSSGWSIDFEGHTDTVYAVCLSGDGRYALSGSHKTLKLWDVATGQCLRTFDGHTDFGDTNKVISVCLSADGQYALSGSADTTFSFKFWKVATGECLRIFDGPTKSVDQRPTSFGKGHYRPPGWETFNAILRSVRLSADGRYALSGSSHGIKLWDIATGRCLRTFEGHWDVWSVCFSVDGRCAVASGSFGRIKLWEIATGQCLRTFEGQTGDVHSVSLSADGRYALSGSSDKTLKLWEIATGQCLRTFEGHTNSVKSVSLSADGRYALSGSGDKTVKLWDVTTGQCLRTFEGHTDDVNSACLSADRRYALSGSEDKTVKLWILDWELEEKQPADWDEGARPYLEIFLASHTPYAGALPQDREPSKGEIVLALTRQGKPVWIEQDFQQLLYTLGCVGYGWLKPEGVRRELDRMTAEQLDSASSGSKKPNRG